MKTALITLRITMIFLPCWFILSLIYILRDDIRKWFKKISEKKDVSKKCSDAKKDVSPKNIYIEKFYEARDRGDSLAMEHALLECRANCSQANSYCLTEVFCPECPFGGMPVMSGRMGMSK